MNALQRNGIGKVTKKAAELGYQKLVTAHPLDEICYRYALRKLRLLQQEERGRADILDTAYQFSGAGQYQTIAPIQVRSELTLTAKFLAAHEPETILEIGTDNGGTFYTWCRGLESATTVLSLDLPGESTPPRFLDPITPETETRFIRADSQKQETRELVEHVLDGKSIDFLFIDGDHTFEGVARDFELYEPLVSDDGLIAFHDIVTIEADAWNQVDRLWDTISPEYTTIEIVENTYDPHAPITVAGTTVTGHGVGILQKN